MRLIKESNDSQNKTNENHEIDFDNAYKSTKNGLIVLNTTGVARVIEVYTKTKNKRQKMITAAQAVNISSSTLRRMVSNTDHPNYQDLVDTIKAPRPRLLTEEYRAYVAPIVKNLEMFKRVLGKHSMPRSVQYLKEINYLSPRGLRARECEYTTIAGMIKHYLLVHDFETPIKAPIKAPIETPIEAPIETPIETPIEAPIQTLNIDILRQLLESAKKSDNPFPFIDCALDILNEATPEV